MTTIRQCAALMMQDDDGRLLFIQQAYGGNLWGFPGGVVDPGETPHQAALREVMEEVGVEAAIDHQVGTYILTGGGWPDIEASVFFGRILSGQPRIADANEIAQVQWIDPTTPPARLVPDAEAGLDDFLAGRTDVSRLHERSITLPEWSEPEAATWQPPTGCKGLIFDCDGTLVDSMPLHFKAWTTVLARHGLALSEERFHDWAGTPIADIIHRLAQEKGITVDADAIGAERDACFHGYPDSELRPVQAVVEIARRFHGRLPMAVATGSTTASAETSLRAIGVFELFDVVVSAQDVDRPKPAPDSFLHAAERIGVAPGECVAFEDGGAGLQAAHAAGMHVVDVRPWLDR